MRVFVADCVVVFAVLSLVCVWGGDSCVYTFCWAGTAIRVS